jgi:hypothetical protein
LVVTPAPAGAQENLMRQQFETHPSRVDPSDHYLAALRAAQIENLRLSERVHRLETQAAPPAGQARACDTRARPQTIRWHSSGSAVFLDDAYLVRGVAGAILWKLVLTHVRSGRRTFTNAELRAAPELSLPTRNHNLEVRLAMLERHLDKANAAVRLDRTSRGQIVLEVRRPFILKEVDDAVSLQRDRTM